MFTHVTVYRIYWLLDSKLDFGQRPTSGPPHHTTWKLASLTARKSEAKERTSVIEGAYQVQSTFRGRGLWGR
jgi:hypothetical protein